MQDINAQLRRASLKELAQKLARQHSTRDKFVRHVQSVLRHCADEAEMTASIEALYRNQRQWFF